MAVKTVTYTPGLPEKPGYYWIKYSGFTALVRVQNEHLYDSFGTHLHKTVLESHKDIRYYGPITIEEPPHEN